MDAYTLFPAVDNPEYRNAQSQFISYLTQKERRAATQAQLADITKLLQGLTSPFPQRAAAIQELVNKKLQEDVGSGIVVDLAPRAADAVSKVREILHMLLVAQWGGDGSFVAGNTLASLRELRDAVEQYLTDRNVFNRGLERANLDARLTAIDLLNSHPRLAQALYDQIRRLTPADAPGVAGVIQAAINDVQRVNAATAARSLPGSVGINPGSIPQSIPGRIRATLFG